MAASAAQAPALTSGACSSRDSGPPSVHTHTGCPHDLSLTPLRSVLTATGAGQGQTVFTGAGYASIVGAVSATCSATFYVSGLGGAWSVPGKRRPAGCAIALGFSHVSFALTVRSGTDTVRGQRPV